MQGYILGFAAVLHKSLLARRLRAMQESSALTEAAYQARKQVNCNNAKELGSFGVT
jgi:hypothetical protein